MGLSAKTLMKELFGTGLGNHFPGKVAESDGRVVKYGRLGILPRRSAAIPGSRGSGSGSAAQNLPSTRAGGQDDVSLNKLPQISLFSAKR